MLWGVTVKDTFGAFARRRSARSIAALAVGVLFAAVLGVAGAVVSTVASSPQSASATSSASNFDAGDLISDSVFYNGTGTSQATIQTLLNNENPSCKASGANICLKNASFPVAATTANSHCVAIPASAGEFAAQIFATVGAACSINPAVLVVLVQKEEGLVTLGPTPVTSSRYRYATGYDCPSSCNGPTGFDVQVYDAAWQFQAYKASTAFTYQPFRENSIAYSPTASCGKSNVYIEDYATAGLYNYTPYQPNAAALANLYGTGNPCSSYGNRNFWTYFNDWFGPSGNLLVSPSFEGSTTGWGAAGGTVNRALYADPTTAQSGNDYLQANSTGTNGAVEQLVKVAASVGKSYTASVWVRAAVSTPTTGSVALVASGGTVEKASEPFTVTNTWTQVQTGLDIHDPGHTGLQLLVYLDANGSKLDIDTANLSPVVWQANAAALTLSSPSLESGIGTWAVMSGSKTRIAVTTSSAAQSGTHYLTATTTGGEGSFGQDISISPVSGDTYSATEWVKSSTSAPYTGKLILWGLGGTNENAQQSFVAGTTWTPVTVNLPITKSGHTRLRLETYLYTLGSSLLVDNVGIDANAIANGSFETGVTNLLPSNGTATIAQGAVDTTVTGLVAGTKQALFSVPASGDSVGIAVPRRMYVGDTYTAVVWVRTLTTGSTASVKLALWTLGDTQQVATVSNATLTSAWTPMTVSVTNGYAANNQLKIELYSYSPGVQIALDAVQLY